MTDRVAALTDRLVRYCAIDTQSDHASATTPSSARQLDLSRLLVEELAALGVEDARITDYGCVLATVPGTAPGPTVGFCAHVDTTEQYNATGVVPRVIRDYNGGPISYPKAPELVLSPDEHPYLAEKTGKTIVTASGDTLLGADDKAGVAIIMEGVRALLASDAPRPTIRIAFTPDEEIGRGVHEDLPKDFGCDFAYTFDGGGLGEMESETFSADGAEVTITGVSIHPGEAFGQMVNAVTLASKLISVLPQATMTPETTRGKQGFIHCLTMAGDAAEMRLEFILRDFERDGLEQKGRVLRAACDALAAGEPRARISCEITPQYRNMRYWLEKDMTPVELARDAIRDIGLEPVSHAIRGGTDGSRLTELGLPCPNLFTGMQLIHGPLEWICVEDMDRAVDLMVAIADRATRS